VSLSDRPLDPTSVRGDCSTAPTGSDRSSSCWFGLYAIPPLGPFYRLGSDLLGYDVRSAQATPGDTRRAVGVEDAWTDTARTFGFHATIVDVLRCRPDDLERIADDVEDLVAALHPKTTLELELRGVRTWNDDTVLLLRYEPNVAFQVFQAATLTRLAPYGGGSVFTDPETPQPAGGYRPHEQRRLAVFGTPRGYDTWMPHFTLLDPCPPDIDADVRQRLAEVFRPFDHVDVTTVCVVVDRGDSWRIFREIAIHGPDRIG
jgi:hypothetical protein